MDQYWKSALLAVLDLVPFLDVIYTPREFFPYSRKFYPTEFSLTRSSRSVGFCIQKDLLCRLDRKLLGEISEPNQIIYSNDVFVVGCINPPISSGWFYYEECRYREYMDLRESVLSGSAGRNVTQYWRVDKGTGNLKVLIVGATNMGNIGDNLIAMAIGGHIYESGLGCSLFFSDFQVSRADLADFDLVIVGGGGIIYSSQFGMNDTDNLANYLKIPIWANEISVPCIILGVGVQGRPGHLMRDPIVREFLTRSLSAASGIFVRDRSSGDELALALDNKIVLMPDLVFSFASQFPYYRSLYDRGSVRAVAFIGELFGEKLAFFNRLLMGDAQEVFKIFEAMDIRYCIMSNDDLPHKDRFVSLLSSKGVECQIHDLRYSSIQEILNLFRDMSGVVTTRFHGLVLSIIAGCPVVSIDLSFGKHSLLIDDYFPSLKNNIINEVCTTDIIIEKLKTLSEMPSSLLPCIDEVEAVSTLTKKYSTILRSYIVDVRDGIDPSDSGIVAS